MLKVSLRIVTVIKELYAIPPEGETQKTKTCHLINYTPNTMSEPFHPIA